MKVEIMFAVASIMLVSAVVVFALPSPVQAAKNQWILNVGGVFLGFKNKGQCEQREQEAKRAGNLDEPCHPLP